jgi:hypothetical protein
MAKKFSKGKQGLTRITALDSRIHLIRGEKVMMDSDLAELYCVETKALKRAVTRNLERFPEDFMFRLTKDELTILRYQFGTSSSHGGIRYLPYAFTQEGIAMLSGVLRSERAVKMNIEIMRAFVRLRHFLQSHEELSCKLERLEKRFSSHDEAIQSIFTAIKQLMMSSEKSRKSKREIGFHVRPTK